jgi:hypothetical protein
MQDVASVARAAIVKRDRGALQPLLHPYLHWVQADGHVVRGRTDHCETGEPDRQLDELTTGHDGQPGSAPD